MPAMSAAQWWLAETPRTKTAEEYAADIILTQISKHGGLHNGTAAKVADKIVEQLKGKGIVLKLRDGAR